MTDIPQTNRDFCIDCDSLAIELEGMGRRATRLGLSKTSHTIFHAAEIAKTEKRERENG